LLRQQRKTLLATNVPVCNFARKKKHGGSQMSGAT